MSKKVHKKGKKHYQGVNNNQSQDTFSGENHPYENQEDEETENTMDEDDEEGEDDSDSLDEENMDTDAREEIE